MFRYHSSGLYKSKKIFNNLFFLFLQELFRVVIWEDKTYHFQHTSFTVVISTERVNCTQLMQQLYSIQLLLLLKTFSHSIYVLMIVVLYCFINLALNLGISILLDTGNWRQWYYSVRTLNETFHPSDVTARSGSHLVTSLFVRRLQCGLLSVTYSFLTTINAMSKL